MSSREYRETHKEQEAAYHREYYRTHRAEKTAHSREYYRTHKEEISAHSREYMRAHKEEKAIYDRTVRRYRRYGIGSRDYWDLFYAQNGKCPVCDNDLDPNKRSDLDHEGGIRTHGNWTKVRGILHPFCNRRVNDNTIESAERIVAYLRNPPAWALWESSRAPAPTAPAPACAPARARVR